MSLSTWFLADVTRSLKVILASESAARLQLLQRIGIEPVVESSGFDEIFEEELSPTAFVQQCSLEKAKRVRERYQTEKREFDLIIGCDTVIELDGEIIGKPKDDENALNVLKRLNGRSHNVLTGVALLTDNKEINFVSSTKVNFRDYPESMYKNYIATREHVGRAGSYSIQGKSAIFVESIDGCFNNVVGVPISEVVSHIFQLYNE